MRITNAISLLYGGIVFFVDFSLVFPLEGHLLGAEKKKNPLEYLTNLVYYYSCSEKAPCCDNAAGQFQVRESNQGGGSWTN